MRLPKFSFPKAFLRQARKADRPLAIASTAEIGRPILLEYTKEKNEPSQIRARRFLFAALIAFCLFYGLAFAFFAPYLLVPFAIPLGILAALVVWALPDLDNPPTRSLDFLLFAFVISAVAWPNYIAVDIPGLPWITVARITNFPLALLFAVCLSTSRHFRQDIAKVWNVTPLVKGLLLLFLAIQVFAVADSTLKAQSIQKFLVDQTGWTAVFFTGIYIFLRPGRAERMAKILWGLVIFVGVIGIFEWRAERVLWAGHIPNFLKIDDPSVVLTLAGSRRLHVGAYRVESTFENPLGLGEYVALSLPFVMHFAFSAKADGLRLAARLSIPFVVFVAFISGSRLGIIGCLLGLAFYTGIWAFLRWKRDPGSLLATLILLAYPVITALGALSIMFVGRVRHIVWGTGSQAYSDMARHDQITMALPLILKRPWGYGIGRAADTLGYAPFGAITIDNYYLSIALDYGILGFIAFYGMLLACIFYSGKRVVEAPFEAEELGLLKASAVALTNFIIMRSVFSEEGNNYIIFMIMGMMLALLYRSRLAAETPRLSPAAVQVRTRPARLLNARRSAGA